MKAIVINGRTFILKESPFKYIRDEKEISIKSSSIYPERKESKPSIDIYISANSTVPDISLVFTKNYNVAKIVRYLYDDKNREIILIHQDGLVESIETTHNYL